MSRRRKKGLLSLFSYSHRKQKASMWQMNAGTNHGGRKKHKGILGF